MKGFFKRDLLLTLPNARFYLLFLAVMAAVSVVASHFQSFLSFYVAIFAMSTLLGLFAYDDQNHWQGYAAATAGGRRAMVCGRYLLCLAAVVLVTGTMVVLGLIGRQENNLSSGLLCGAQLCFYRAVAMPLSYRFGTGKSRLILLIALGATMGLVGLTAQGLEEALEWADRVTVAGITLPQGMSLFTMSLWILGVALALLALSWPVSLWVMEKKEF